MCVPVFSCLAACGARSRRHRCAWSAGRPEAGIGDRHGRHRGQASTPSLRGSTGLEIARHGRRMRRTYIRPCGPVMPTSPVAGDQPTSNRIPRYPLLPRKRCNQYPENTGMGHTTLGWVTPKLDCDVCPGVFVPAPGLQILRRELAMTSAPGKITNVTQVLPRATGWPPVPSIWSSRGRGSSELRVNVSGQRDVPTTQLSAPAPPERQ